MLAFPLREKLAQGPLTVETGTYGGFERVGDLLWALPASDAQMAAGPGDIVLYGGDSIVLFYGTNAWVYTKLGHIENMSAGDGSTASTRRCLRERCLPAG